MDYISFLSLSFPHSPPEQSIACLTIMNDLWNMGRREDITDVSAVTLAARGCSCASNKMGIISLKKKKKV